MILFVSFFLTILIYFLIALFFYFSFFKAEIKKKQEVLIHTAIVKAQVRTTGINIKNKKSVKVTKKSAKKSVKKRKVGSKSSVTKGGEVSFKDIFKNVKENVKTSNVKFQKNLEMSRFKGIERLEKRLKNYDFNFQVTFSSNSDNKNIDEIVKKISKVWDEISQFAGEYAKIKVINGKNGVEVLVLDSNLDSAKQIELINKIKSLNFNKDFEVNILFQTKVNK